MKRRIFTQDHDLFRETARAFFLKECAPNLAEWEASGGPGRELWLKAGEAGLLGWEVPEEYGGSGITDFRFNAILAEEMICCAAGSLGFAVNNDIVLPYLLTLANNEQKARWLPGTVSGEIILAIAMSEPGMGSDINGLATTARRDGDHYVVNGAKTFITNGRHATHIVTAVRTDAGAGHQGISLVMLEEGMSGLVRGRQLDKIGAKSSDTAELFFEDVRVPARNLLGSDGGGFYSLMHNLPRERLGIAVHAVARARRALEITLDYTKNRQAFGQPIASFQANKFALAEMYAKLGVMQVYVDRCIEELLIGELDAVEAAGAKHFLTESEWEILDRCLQLHGGYGYINEYEIARLWRDGRIQRIYGGSSEIMKEIIGRSLLRTG